jgi:hypothetical protein
MLSPFPVALRRTGVRFLGIPFAPGTWAFVTCGLPAVTACAEAEQSAKAGREG